MALFIAKHLGKGVIQYISRRSGRVYILRPDYAEYGNYGFVVTSDNLEILGSDRAELLSLIEIADQSIIDEREGELCS